MNGVDLPDESDVLKALRRSVMGGTERSPLPADLAANLGVHPKVVRNWLNGVYHLPAAALPTICRIVNDFAILDVIEHKLGRVAVKMDVALNGYMPETVELQRFIREFGEAVQTVAATLEDGRVDDHELPATIKELSDVIEQALRLQYMLQALNRRQHV